MNPGDYAYFVIRYGRDDVDVGNLDGLEGIEYTTSYLHVWYSSCVLYHNVSWI